MDVDMAKAKLNAYTELVIAKIHYDRIVHEVTTNLLEAGFSSEETTKFKEQTLERAAIIMRMYE